MSDINFRITSSDYVYIDFDYDRDLINYIKKNIPNRKYVKRSKEWKFKLNKNTLADFLTFLNDWDIDKDDVPKSIQNRMKSIIKEAKEHEKRKEKNQKIINADEVDLEVKGLARGMNLYPFQEVAVKYVEKNKNVLIGDEQGLGKTVESIASIHHLDAYPVLVVCPASLKDNWEREWNTWLPRKSTKVQHSSDGLDLRARVVIINYDILWKYRKELKDWGFKGLILDESHYCFPYETQVMTDQGYQNIGDIVENGVGDYVLSYNHEKKKEQWQKITNRFRNPHTSRLVKISHKNGELVCTQNHKIWSETKNKWVKAKNINENEKLRVLQKNIQTEDGESKILFNKMEISRQSENQSFECVRVDSIEILERRSEQEYIGLCGEGSSVYDIEVEDTHNYYANGVLVHNCKNSKAKRSKAARQIAKKIDGPKILLSGTAVVNRPKELINQLKILDVFKKEFGNFYNFANRFCGAKQTPWGMDYSGASNLEELHERLAATCYIRRNKKEVLPDLPDKQRQYIEMDITNRKEYDLAEEDLVAYYKKAAAEDKDFLESISHLTTERQEKKLIKYAKEMGKKAEYAEDLMRLSALRKLASKGKMKEIKSWIRDFLETGEQLVVFGHHKEPIEEIVDEFDALKINGDVPIKDRQQIVDDFQDEKNQLIVLNIQSGGTGLTLTASTNVAFMELPWTPGEVAQCEDRCHRIGTKSAVNIYFLLGRNTIDMYMFELLKKKRIITEAVNRGEDITDENGNIIKGVIQKLEKKHD